VNFFERHDSGAIRRGSCLKWGDLLSYCYIFPTADGPERDFLPLAHGPNTDHLCLLNVIQPIAA
jgi:hypothetical protein